MVQVCLGPIAHSIVSTVTLDEFHKRHLQISLQNAFPSARPPVRHVAPVDSAPFPTPDTATAGLLQDTLAPHGSTDENHHPVASRETSTTDGALVDFSNLRTDLRVRDCGIVLALSAQPCLPTQGTCDNTTPNTAKVVWNMNMVLFYLLFNEASISK